MIVKKSYIFLIVISLHTGYSTGYLSQYKNCLFEDERFSVHVDGINVHTDSRAQADPAQ
jgi:hypothetical protein